MDVQPITIFIPTYKRPQLLKRAIASALAQTWKNISVVVCDNGSEDNTKEVVNEFVEKDQRVHYICHPTNIGMLANYQFAISILNTEFFSFLSDDDLLLPHFCETAMNGFLHYNDIAFFACSTIILSLTNGILRVPLQLWPREGRFTPQEGLPEMIGKFPPPTTILFKKTASIDCENQAGWDCDFLIQLAGQFPFAISKEPCGIMINHPTSFTSEQGYEKSLESICKLTARIKEFSWMDATLKTATLKSMKNYLDQMTFMSILSHILENRLRLARKISYEMFKEHPFEKKALISVMLSFLCSLFPCMRHLLLLLKNGRKKWQDRKFAKQGFSSYQKFVS